MRTLWVQATEDGDGKLQPSRVLNLPDTETAFSRLDHLANIGAAKPGHRRFFCALSFCSPLARQVVPPTLQWKTMPRAAFVSEKPSMYRLGNLLIIHTTFRLSTYAPPPPYHPSSDSKSCAISFTPPVRIGKPIASPTE